MRIIASGTYVPRRRVTAADLDTQLGVAPGTCLARNGVATRYFAASDETASMMAAAAIRSTGVDVSTLDAIIFTGVMPEQPMPCTAILIHRLLGGRATGTTCFDVNASCAGFLKVMELAASGLWHRTAVVSVEIASKGLRWHDLDTCTLFGDGAAAFIFEHGAEHGEILATRNVTLSQGADLCQMRAGGSRFNVVTPPSTFDDYLFSMQGRSLLRLVQEHFPPFLDELLALAPVKLVVPHQASAVGLAFLRKQLARHGLPAIDILTEFGNQVSASIPFALHHAIGRGMLQRGDIALLVATAAGVTMNGIVLRY